MEKLNNIINKNFNKRIEWKNNNDKNFQRNSLKFILIFSIKKTIININS